MRHKTAAARLFASCRHGFGKRCRAKENVQPLFGLVLVIACSPACGGDWSGFRGPDGLGISVENDLPLRWSDQENLAWKAALPGPGASSPIVAGQRVVVTCYTGYGLAPNEGKQEDLRRHVLCLDRQTGKLHWTKEFVPALPEHQYQGEGAYHGYAASTPASDGERLYVFFGKSGVYCLDLEGNELWHAKVGDGINGWGSGCSPVLFGKLLLVNASVESGAIVALDKLNGAEVWRAGGIRAAWNTPLLFRANNRAELVVSAEGRLLSFNPADGTPLWNADGVHRYVCPSVVAHNEVVYAIGGGHTSLAVRAGGSGDVTGTHVVWRKNKGSNVSSPVYHEGRLIWASESGGFVCAQDASSGETLYQERLNPTPGNIWSSALLADGKLYLVSQSNGTYVVSAGAKFEQLAHNRFESDTSRTNASPIVHHGQILMRTDRFLYCIGARQIP
jgi:hypothetical protein